MYKICSQCSIRFMSTCDLITCTMCLTKQRFYRVSRMVSGCRNNDKKRKRYVEDIHINEEDIHILIADQMSECIVNTVMPHHPGYCGICDQICCEGFPESIKKKVE